MNRIQVLHVVGAMNCGGAESMIMNIFRNIDRTKYQFHFLYYTKAKCYYDEEILCLGGIIHNLNPLSGFSMLSILKQIKSLCRELSIDIVHAHTSLSIGFAMYSANKAGVPIRIAHSHTTFDPRRPSLLRKLYNIFMRFLIRKHSNLFLMCSTEAGEYLFGKDYCVRKYIINNAINTKDYLFDVNIRRFTRGQLGIEENIFVVGHIGTYKTPKNHTFLLDVFKEICEINKDSLLILVGDGSLKDEIKKKIESLGLNNNVRMLGIRNDVNKLLQAMDVFVFPSLYEGLPMTLIEAQTSGLKCFVSNSISVESNISGTIEFLDLQLSAKRWAELIMKSDFTRKYNHNKIIKSGFDIEYSVNQIMQAYNGDLT